MSVATIQRWTGSGLEPLEYCDLTTASINAADSWFVTGGAALGIDLHRERFLGAIDRGAIDRGAVDRGAVYRGGAERGAIDSSATAEASRFWDAALAAIPRSGEWFPRVESHSNGRLILRLRDAPERTRSVVVATWTGSEPRTAPRHKGPDLEAMLRIRTAVQPLGADEAILLTPDGYVVEGAYSGLLWWRGDIVCGPPREFDRIDSVTARSVLTLATALGVDTHEEAVTPAELDGTELWALSALHGIRIVTRWIDGPQLAEKPGRLDLWRRRLDALRRPI